MKFSNFLACFAVPLTLTGASTSYGCWSAAGPKFRDACSHAYVNLIHRWTGRDGYTWVPSLVQKYKFSDCQASIQVSRPANGRTIWAGDLLASFNKLGSWCQNGWINYADGHGNWFFGQLQGSAQRLAGNDDGNNTTPFTYVVEEKIRTLEDATPASIGLLHQAKNVSSVNDDNDDEGQSSVGSSSSSVSIRSHPKSLTKRQHPRVGQWTNNGRTLSVYRVLTSAAARNAVHVQVAFALKEAIRVNLARALDVYDSVPWTDGITVTTHDAPGGVVGTEVGVVSMDTDWGTWAQFFIDNNIWEYTFMCNALIDDFWAGVQRDGWSSAIYKVETIGGSYIGTIILNAMKSSMDMPTGTH